MIWYKDKPLIALMILTTVLYSILVVVRHWHFETNTWDFGLFDQTVWHYSQFEEPGITTLGLKNALGDHFSPILVLCAPLFWIYPHAEMLLIVQPVLFAITLIPIFLFCEKRIGCRSTYFLLLSFIFFWGVQHTVRANFHQDIFAVPLIAFAIYLIDIKKWVAASLSILLLLTVKEDLTVLVVFFGVYLTMKGKTKLGWSFIAIGILFFYLEVMVWVPLLHGTAGSYQHWLYTDFGAQPGASLQAVLRNPLLLFQVLFAHGNRIKTLFFLFGPFLFLPLYSRLVILMIPLVASKLFAADPLVMGMIFHYSATLCPILVMAAADGLFNWKNHTSSSFFPTEGRFSAPVFILMINLLLIPFISPWRDIDRADFWKLSDTDKTSAQVFSLIPPSASVATQSSIAPHLSHRQTIYSLGSNADCGTIDPDFFVVCDGLSCWPIEFSAIQACLNEKMKQGYQKIFESNGWVVLEKESYRKVSWPPIS